MTSDHPTTPQSFHQCSCILLYNMMNTIEIWGTLHETDSLLDDMQWIWRTSLYCIVATVHMQHQSLSKLSLSIDYLSRVYNKYLQKWSTVIVYLHRLTVLFFLLQYIGWCVLFLLSTLDRVAFKTKQSYKLGSLAESLLTRSYLTSGSLEE